MWGNPRLLNALSGFLVGLVVLACAAAGMHTLLGSSLFPLRAVEVTAAPLHVSRETLEAAIVRHARGNFFAAPLPELRAALEQLPWVRRATVRRVWPDRLEVALEEHVPLARWGAGALVNTYGERFAGETDAPLPLFIGPPGTETEIARRYAALAALVAPLGSPLERVVLSARHAWQLRLASGLQLTLGRDTERDAVEQRLARFVDAFSRHPLAGKVDAVDLRYPGGFSVRTRL